MADEIEAKPAVISIEGGDPVAATVAVIEPTTEVPAAIEAVAEGAEAEAEAEAIETVADSAVAIAEIEANRDITINAIHAETEQARIDADKERAEPWHELMTNMQEQMQALTERVDRLTPPSSLAEPEAIAEAAAEAATEAAAETLTTVTPGTETETSSETRTEAPDESEAERPEAEAREAAEAIGRKVRRKLTFL